MPGSSEGSSVESIDLALPTALADPDALALAARRAIANTPGLVVLVSNQLVPVEDPRLVQVTPDQAMNGVGIDSLQVVGVPRPQAMVRIANESDLSEATLSIHSDGQTIEDEIKLPDRGGAKNYFMDLPSAGKVIEADLSAEGDSLVDQKAWSVQRSVWPKIEADTGIVPELTKMIDVYGRLRPAGADSTTVTVTTAPRELNREAAVAVWLNPQPDDVPVQVSQGLVVAKGPLSTEGVNWDDVLADATAAHVGPEGDWEPVVSAGKFVLVAIREHPVRQVWIGFQAAGFSDRADFVVFWSEIFNWLGKAGPVYSAQTIPSPNGDWVPILSHSADGSVTAYNAPPMPEHLVDHLEWRDNLGKLPPRLRVGERPLAGLLLLGALALMCLAAATWPAAKVDESVAAWRNSRRGWGASGRH